MKFIVFLKYNYVFSSHVTTPVPFGRGRRRVSQMLFFLSNFITRSWRLGSLPVSCISSRSGIALVFYFDRVFCRNIVRLIRGPWAFESFAGRATGSSRITPVFPFAKTAPAVGFLPGQHFY